MKMDLREHEAALLSMGCEHNTWRDQSPVRVPSLIPSPQSHAGVWAGDQDETTCSVCHAQVQYCTVQ